MKCQKCNEENLDQSKFCKNCGAEQLEVETKPIFTKLQKIGATVLVVGVGVGFFAGSKMMKDKNNNPDVMPQEMAEEQVASSTSDTISTQELPIDNEAQQKRAEIEKYEISMLKYANMSVDEFELLDRDERLRYSNFLIDQTIIKGNYDFYYGDNTKKADYALKYTPASIDNNGQEIIDNIMLVEQIAYLQFEENVEQKYDIDDAQKVFSFKYKDVGKGIVTKDYVSAKEFAQSLDEPTAITNKQTAVNTSELMTGTPNTEGLQYKEIEFTNSDGETFFARTVFYEFINYDGAKKGVWLIDTQQNTLNELHNS